MLLALAAALVSGCATRGPAVSPTLPSVEAPANRPVKIGLALGGGAARGFAHVGVIAVLEEAGLKPSVLVGTSAGSLVAALYASGKTSAQLQQTALNMEEVAITDWMLPIFGRGMFRGEALGRYVNELLAGRSIENMVIPLGIVATDLNSGQSMLFQRGDTGTAVRASSAVPAVFVPVKINGREYVDGGLVSPVPVRFARQMGADLVIAVDISSAPEANPAKDTLQILLQTFAIMGKSINQYELKDADVVVQPSQVGLKSADFSARQRAIDSGRAAMLSALPALRARLEVLRTQPR
ncbi:MAG TPA: patatin-like phospholipase family protein [Polaromonas sp.]|uniref:patatin-like phospholipase family protein n=1 Tax=Polaromonas sp. TaxID=1869339 RepID=UPI002D349A6C|nr:patatin-like phospholipase family protein [Polaromonas sp.]HYW57751.1 patatin-like phospholipase family protein [Polaromonas sp.]